MSKHTSLVIGLVALTGLFAVGWIVTPLLAEKTPGAARPAAHSAAARTTLAGLAPASGEPALASLGRLAPSQGTVVQAPGPFDDRFTLHGVAFDGSRVTGSAAITSDVSDILEFEALAGFYDARGHLVGTGRFTYHHDESAGHSDASAGGIPIELKKFSIAVPANLRGTAVAAAVGVPVLVNE